MEYNLLLYLISGPNRRDRSLSAHVNRNSYVSGSNQQSSVSVSYFAEGAPSRSKPFSPSVVEAENDSQEDLFQDPMPHTPKPVSMVTDIGGGERSRAKHYFTPAERTPRDQLYTPELVAGLCTIIHSPAEFFKGE